MPYGIDMNYVRATQEGVNRGLQRRQVLQQLEQEEAQERDRLSKLAEETKRYRTEAQGMGISKQEAEAMSVGEARGYVEAQQEMRKRKQQESGRLQAHRDLRAAAATGKKAAQLSPAEVSFLMRQAGIKTPEMVAGMWDEIDRLDRARLLGVQDKTVLDDLAKQSDQERQWAAELRQRDEFKAGEDQRKATLEQTRESTTATKENQRRQAAEEARLAADLAKYGEGPISGVFDGKKMFRNPGELKWKSPAELDLITKILGGGAGDKDLQDKADQAAGTGKGVPKTLPEQAAAARKMVEGAGKELRVTTEDDYNRLPSGAVYIDPKGVKRRKP